MKSTKKTKKSQRIGGHSPRRAQRARQSPPAASRVVATLREAGRPLNFDELAARIGRDGKAARRRLQEQLDELLHAAEIIRNRRDEYCLRERLPLVVGTVSGHRDGLGFVLPDDRSAPVFLAPRQMLETMHGDRVAVRISGQDNRGRPQGAIVEVLERNTREIVGRLYEESGISFVVPDNPRIGHRVFVPRGHLGGARAGQVVLVRPRRAADAHGAGARSRDPRARRARRAGHGDRDRDPFARSAVRVSARGSCRGRSVRSQRVRRSEARARRSARAAAGHDRRRGRARLRRRGVLRRSARRLAADRRDRRRGDYVSQDSALDKEAQNRGTSVYFPNRVLPMLPEALSNGLCSLNPKVDRLCMVCEMRVSPQGKVTRARFFEGVMRSAARLTYTKVAAYLANPTAGHEPEVVAVGPQLMQLHAVFKALLRRTHAARRAGLRRAGAEGALRRRRARSPRSSSRRATMRTG